jgi:hypothetical protein
MLERSFKQNNNPNFKVIGHAPVGSKAQSTGAATLMNITATNRFQNRRLEDLTFG